LSAANGWYSEIKFYPWPAHDGKNGVFDPKTGQNGVIGHFTAQVWKNSKLVGYGIGQRAGCDKVFVVSRYSPTGNMQGWDRPSTLKSYKDNVLPLV